MNFFFHFTIVNTYTQINQVAILMFVFKKALDSMNMITIFAGC